MFPAFTPAARAAVIRSGGLATATGPDDPGLCRLRVGLGQLWWGLRRWHMAA